MLRNTPKVVALLIAVIMVLAMVGCQPTASPSAPAATSAAAAATSKAADKTAVPEAPVTADLPFVSITHYALGDPPASGAVDVVQAEWNKLLKEKLNCELIQSWVNWTDYMAKYNLLLASGDPTIDIVETSSTWLELWQNADRGAWLPLNDLIPQYAPLTWAEVPQDVWDRCRFRGDIVCFPEDGYTQYVNHGIMYRGDWAEAAGLPKQFTTIEEFEQYGDWIVANKPGVFPIDTDKGFNFWGNWVKMYTDYIPVLGFGTGSVGLVFGESLENPFTVVTPVMEDVFVKYAQDMKRWADKGFWREDVLNNTASLRDSLKAGTSGVDLHHVQTFRGLKWEMENKLFPGEADLEIVLWCDLDGGELIQDPIPTHGGCAVYAYSKNPERAVMVYEEIRQNEQMYKLFNFGIEGVQYIINDKGQKAQPDSYDKAKDEFYTDFWGGRVDRFEYPSTTEWPGIYDYWKRLDGIVVPNPYDQFVFDKAGIDAELTALMGVTNELGPMIHTGKAADPVKAVEDLRAKVKSAGFDKLVEYCQAQLDAYKVQLGK